MKLKEVKEQIEKIQEEHENTYYKIKKDFEFEKFEKEKELEEKKNKIIKTICELEDQMNFLRNDFYMKEKAIEDKCMDDYFEMNLKNEKSKN